MVNQNPEAGLRVNVPIELQKLGKIHRVSDCQTWWGGCGSISGVGVTAGGWDGCGSISGVGVTAGGWGGCGSIVVCRMA